MNSHNRKVKYNSDLQYYYQMCERHNERPKELYSWHYRWLDLKDRGQTKMSYGKYEKAIRKDYLMISVKHELDKLERIQNRINTLRQELKKLR